MIFFINLVLLLVTVYWKNTLFSKKLNIHVQNEANCSITIYMYIKMLRAYDYLDCLMWLHVCHIIKDFHYILFINLWPFRATWLDYDYKHTAILPTKVKHTTIHTHTFSYLRYQKWRRNLPLINITKKFKDIKNKHVVLTKAKKNILCLEERVLKTLDRVGCCFVRIEASIIKTPTEKKKVF